MSHDDDYLDESASEKAEFLRFQHELEAEELRHQQAMDDLEREAELLRQQEEDDLQYELEYEELLREQEADDLRYEQQEEEFRRQREEDDLLYEQEEDLRRRQQEADDLLLLSMAPSRPGCMVLLVTLFVLLIMVG